MNKKCRITDGSVIDFTAESLISIGAGLGREIIVLDPESEFLKKLYEGLKLITVPNQPLQKTITDTINYVRKCLRTDTTSENETTTFVKKAESDPKVYLYQGFPILPIEAFIGVTGVCRHHALLLAYMLNRLQKDELLPPGIIHHVRDNVRGGAHVWVTYQPTNSAEFYLIDSLWNTCVDIHSTANSDKSIRGYGDKALNNCRTRFYKEPSSPSKQGMFQSTPDINNSIKNVCDMLVISEPNSNMREQLLKEYNKKPYSLNPTPLYIAIQNELEIPDLKQVNKYCCDKIGAAAFDDLLVHYGNKMHMLGVMKDASFVTMEQWALGQQLLFNTTVQKVLGMIQQQSISPK